MKFAKSSVLVLASAALLNACGTSENSDLNAPSRKSYQLGCISNISFDNGVGPATYTIRAQGTKIFKQADNKLVEPKKAGDEYKQTLIKLQGECNGSFAKINASGCGNIRWDNVEVLKRDENDPSRSNIIPFQYTAVGILYRGEYFCSMIEAPANS